LNTRLIDLHNAHTTQSLDVAHAKHLAMKNQNGNK